FVRETRLIKSEFLCPKCNVPKTFGRKNSISDGYSWICRNSRNNKVCGSTKTIRHGSWFSCSKLKLNEIFRFTQHLIMETRTKDIKAYFYFSSDTLADWRQFVNEVILDHVETTSEKIGGEGKIVEADE
ncbi:DDE_Tnp_IS1595 domain-containing protein, partial [Trichonephila inaurata madagascariensis]